MAEAALNLIKTEGLKAEKVRPFEVENARVSGQKSA